MAILDKPYKAIIIGSSGSIGSAFVRALESDSICEQVLGLHRHSEIKIDYDHPETIQMAYQHLMPQGPFQLLIISTGVLHTKEWSVEKKISDLNPHHLHEIFNINAIGPALVIKEFSKLMDKNGSVMAVLSAKVGSIEDNRLGGWYGYRSSKAARNMMIKTAAIELKRTNPNLALIAMHPGTVSSNLSKPFGGESIGQDPDQAASHMLTVMRGLTPENSGQFLSYKNEVIPW